MALFSFFDERFEVVESLHSSQFVTKQEHCINDEVSEVAKVAASFASVVSEPEEALVPVTFKRPAADEP